MPKYYTFDLKKIDNFNEQTQNKYSNAYQLASLTRNSVPLAVIFLLVLTLREDNPFIRIIYITTALFFLYSLQRTLVKDPYLVMPYHQAYIKINDRQIIADTYHFLNTKYHDVLEEFKQIKNINSLEEFVLYYEKKSERGLCKGYTYALMKQIAIHPHTEPEVWFHELVMSEVIKNQLIEHVANEVNNEFAKENVIHLCDKDCICHKAKELSKELLHIPNIIAVNSLHGRLVREELSEPQIDFQNLFDRHFRSLGFVSPEKVKPYGNHPTDDITDESMMTSSELQELTPKIDGSNESSETNSSLSAVGLFRAFKRMELNETLKKRKANYINENLEEINLEKYSLVGEISSNSKKEGHSMLFKFSKNNIVFFDSNHGLYRYPSSKIFSQRVKQHILEKIDDADGISVRTFLFNKQGVS